MKTIHNANRTLHNTIKKIIAKANYLIQIKLYTIQFKMFTTKNGKNQILQSWHAIGGNEIWFQEWPGASFIIYSLHEYMTLIQMKKYIYK